MLWIIEGINKRKTIDEELILVNDGGKYHAAQDVRIEVH